MVAHGTGKTQTLTLNRLKRVGDLRQKLMGCRPFGVTAPYKSRFVLCGLNVVYGHKNSTHPTKLNNQIWWMRYAAYPPYETVMEPTLAREFAGIFLSC